MLHVLMHPVGATRLVAAQVVPLIQAAIEELQQQQQQQQQQQ